MNNLTYRPSVRNAARYEEAIYEYYKGMPVEQVLKNFKISRPTLYKILNSMRKPIDLNSINERLENDNAGGYDEASDEEEEQPGVKAGRLVARKLVAPKKHPVKRQQYEYTPRINTPKSKVAPCQYRDFNNEAEDSDSGSDSQYTESEIEYAKPTKVPVKRQVGVGRYRSSPAVKKQVNRVIVKRPVKNQPKQPAYYDDIETTETETDGGDIYDYVNKLYK